MILKQLSLANYRGFDQLELCFCPDVTVIAGVNGSGKSGLLKVLRQLCSKLETEVLALNTAPVSLENCDIQIGKDSLSASLAAEAMGEMVSIQIGRALFDDSEIPAVEKKISDLRAELRFTEKRSKEAISIEVAIESLERRLKGYDDSESIHAPGYATQESTDAPLPIFAFYSTQRAFTGLPKKLLKAKPLSTEAAHEHALIGGRVALNNFANWFRVAVSGELGETGSGEYLWGALRKSISEILPDFSELKLETPDKMLPFFSIEKNGTRFPLSQLSDGENALLALAMDITQRLALANPRSMDPTTEGVGIIFIDEIELHLHPKWQRQVLRRLSKAFPNCQFIATTHSSLVLGEVEASCVRFLEPNENTGRIEVYVPPESFGLDSNRVLDELMGASERNKEIANKLAQLFSLIDNDKFDEAREAMQLLAEKLGADEPELARAQALINFLEG